MINIPSDDDFIRASKQMEEDSRNLDIVRSKFIGNFKNNCHFHDFYILDQIDVKYRAYIFFKNDEDILICEKNGILNEMIDFVFIQLEVVGCGKKGEIDVAFEIDSDENVKKKFQGDYFLRLR